MFTIWTTDRVERLTKLWADGLSGRNIAIELDCGTSRNAVIGKIKRLKLPHPVGKQSDVGLHRTPRPAPRPVDLVHPQRRNQHNSLAEKLAIAAAEPGLREEAEAPDGTGIKISELTEITCRFPRGDPRKPDFEFCGALAIPGPWCARHAQLVYQPPYCRDRADKELLST